MVYNNFEIVHVPRFQAADIGAFNAAVDATMRIYSHRCVSDGCAIATDGFRVHRRVYKPMICASDEPISCLSSDGSQRRRNCRSLPVHEHRRTPASTGACRPCELSMRQCHHFRTERLSMPRVRSGGGTRRCAGSRRCCSWTGPRRFTGSASTTRTRYTTTTSGSPDDPALSGPPRCSNHPPGDGSGSCTGQVSFASGLRNTLEAPLHPVSLCKHHIEYALG